jgi:SWI/SNF-related matrix-associated actin-dependent regulator 1 of chromatin subfamily A
MSLSINPTTKAFILTSDDDKAAKKAGLTLSTRVRGNQGEKVWFTADKQQDPTFNPYAALPFWEEANEVARSALAPYYDDYLKSWAKETSYLAPCPPDKEFYPFQNAGIEYAMDRGHVLIGDQPGLGKTAQAVGIANVMEAKRVLIVCPASIRLAWQREIRAWSTLRRVSTYPVLKSSDGINPHVNYTIISYDLLRNLGIHDALCAIDWDLLVLDEAHYLKTLDATRTRAVFGGGMDVFALQWLAQNTRKIVGLTGTPLPNRPRECYTLARAMCWESIDYMSADAFSNRFNPPGGYVNGHKIAEVKGRLPELRSRLRCNFMVRRMKKDVLTDLPDKHYEMTYVEQNAGIRSTLKKESMLDFNPGDVMKGDCFVDGEIATVRREMGEAMVPRMVEHCRYLLDIVGIEKIGFMCVHRSVMDEFTETMSKYGVVANRGGMTTNKKDEAVTAFRTNPDIRIFLGQVDSVAGIDGLQEVCDYVVIGEPSWVPGNNEQAIDRFHRIGQHSNVIAQFLLAEGSFNELVLGIVLDKAIDTHIALDAK